MSSLSEQRAPACVTTVHVEGFTYEVIFSTSEEGPQVDVVIYYWCQGVKHDEFVDCKVNKCNLHVCNGHTAY